MLEAMEKTAVHKFFQRTQFVRVAECPDVETFGGGSDGSVQVKMQELDVRQTNEIK